MWDIVDPVNGEKREKELVENYWQDLIKDGAVTGRFSGDRSSALRVLDAIKAGGDLHLTIQRELVDESLPLERTAAGSYLGHEFLRLADAENIRILRDNIHSKESIFRTNTESVAEFK